jgi:hypothetical protein
MKAVGRDHLNRWNDSLECASRIFKPGILKSSLRRCEQIEAESKLAVWATMCEYDVFMQEKD